MADWRAGTIIRVCAGLMVLSEDVSQKLFYFTFDKISDYFGEEPTELTAFGPKGLVPGVTVKFTTVLQGDEVHKIEIVNFVAPASQ